MSSAGHLANACALSAKVTLEGVRIAQRQDGIVSTPQYERGHRKGTYERWPDLAGVAAARQVCAIGLGPASFGSMKGIDTTFLASIHLCSHPRHERLDGEHGGRQRPDHSWRWCCIRLTPRIDQDQGPHTIRVSCGIVDGHCAT